MAKLIPAIIVFFCFTALLSSSHARSPVTSTEDATTDLPPATFIEEDVSDLKSLIALPTDKVKEDGKFEFPGEVQAVKSIEGGEKQLEEFHLPPMNRRFERMRAFRCRHGHRGPRSDGGDQIRPFWREEGDDEHHHHRHHHHHGEVDEPRFHEVDPARLPGFERDGRMIGEFKQPDFFFGRHHHHHHDGDEDWFHHGVEEHHRHRKGHGFWKAIRKIMGPF